MDPQSSQQQLTQTFCSLEANESCSEAVLTLQDDSRLCFIHTVEKRQALAVGPEGQESEHRSAEALLNQIKKFRLNSKHLEIWFLDESRWEMKPTPGSRISSPND